MASVSGVVDPQSMYPEGGMKLGAELAHAKPSLAQARMYHSGKRTYDMVTKVDLISSC